MSYEGIVEADPTKPYEAMARRLVYSPFNGPAQRRIDRALEMAKTVGADGAVWFCHWGCKHTLGGAGWARRPWRRPACPPCCWTGTAVTGASAARDRPPPGWKPFWKYWRAWHEHHLSRL